MHLPSLLAALAVVVAFEAGWALFRQTWAAGATAAAQVAMICFAPGQGGSYVFLSLPATAARQLLVPAALALALECMRAPTRGLVLSTAAAGLRAGRRPSRRTRSSSGSRSSASSPCGRSGSGRTSSAARSRSAHSSSRPRSSCSGCGRSSRTRARSHPTRPSSTAHSRSTAGSSSSTRTRRTTSPPEVFTRAGAVAIAALLLVPVAGFAARRRWAAYVVGRRARGVRVHARPLPLHAHSPTPSPSRRRGVRRGSCPSRSPSSAAWACSASSRGRS